jgi:hypothetical protein
MKKKISVSSDYAEEYRLLAIAGALKDYTLAYFINKQLGIQLKKYKDLSVPGHGGYYSWYYFKQGNKYMSCYLIGNNHSRQKLIPALKHFDFFFLVKDVSDEEQLQLMVTGIRKIQNVVGVFEQNMLEITGMDELFESNELHEMEQIISPAKKIQNKN